MSQYNCDVIKTYLQQIQLREKGLFFSQSVAQRTNDTSLYTYMKTILTRKISLLVTVAMIKNWSNDVGTKLTGWVNFN